MRPPIVMFGVLSLLLAGCPKDKKEPTAADDFAMICAEAAKAKGTSAADQSAFAKAVEAKLATPGAKTTWGALGSVGPNQRLYLLKAGADDLGMPAWDCPAIANVYGPQRNSLEPKDHGAHLDKDSAIDKGTQTDSTKDDVKDDVKGAATVATPAVEVVVDAKATQVGTSSDQANIVKKVRTSYLKGLKACHNRIKKKNPSAKGKVTLSFTVEKDGKVSDAKANGFDDEFDACAVSLVKNWRFSPPSDKAPLKILFPIVLN